MAGETETYAFRKCIDDLGILVCVFAALLVGRAMGAREIWAGRVGSAEGGCVNNGRGSA